MELQKVSRRYRIRLLQETDMDDILRLSESNPMFYEYCPPFVTRESILNDMKALPQGKTDAEKYYIGFFEGQKLIAIMDMVFAFPDDETVYIGLFMVDHDVQGYGIGSIIIKNMQSIYVRWERKRSNWHLPKEISRVRHSGRRMDL